MLSSEPGYNKLSNDARLRLDAYYRRFCQGLLGDQYGHGHLIYACHASFPLLLSPELANLIWINFKNYYYKATNEPAQINAITVSDFLLSPLCREIGFQRYEVYPEIRSYLLMLLTDGTWFEAYGIRKEGKARLNDLADFLQQYLVRKVPNSKYDGAAFRQLNNWAVMAWQKPQQLATEVAKAFAANYQTENKKGQLWLSLQMEKLGLQYEQHVNNSDDRKDLNAFYQIYYYGKARREELSDKAVNTYDYAKEIPNYIDTNTSANEITIRLPLLKSAVERTERKIKDVQRVIGLFVAIDTYQNESMNMSAQGEIAKNTVSNLVMLLEETYNLENPNRQVEFEATLLLNEEATLENIRTTLTNTYKKANEEDIVLFFFSGHPVIEMNSVNQYMLVCYDTPPDRLAEKAFTNTEFLNIAYKNGKGNQSVLILDTTMGDFLWGMVADVFIGGGSTREFIDTGTHTYSTFMAAFFEILIALRGEFTYKRLFQYIKYRMSELVVPDTPRSISLLAKPDSLHKKFLSRRLSTQPGYPLLLHSNTKNTWELVAEDFVVWPAGGPAELYDYSMNRLQPELFSGIIVNEAYNVLEATDIPGYFLQTGIYHIKPSRPSLAVVMLFDEIADDDELTELAVTLRKTEFGGYSKWSALHTEPPVTNITSLLDQLSYSFILVQRSSSGDGKGFEVSFYEKSATQLPDRPIIIRATDRYRIIEAISKLVRWKSILHLELPMQDNIRYEHLDVSFNWLWMRDDEIRRDQNDSGMLVISDKCISIKAGELYWDKIVAEIINHETFAINYEIYLLVSDGTIRNVTPALINRVNPGSTIFSYFDESLLLERMQTEGLEINIKVLFSRDPVQFGIEQTV